MSIASVLRLSASILLFILNAATSIAQPSQQSVTSRSIFNHFDQLYRIDSRLISGNFYQDLSPKSTAGHPFYGDPEWKTGSVTIGNIVSDSLILRYDICLNELICNTITFTNSSLQIALNKSNITGFKMGSKNFLQYPFPDQEKPVRFCEVLSKGPVTLLLLQSKNLKVPIGGNTSYAYETFSKMTLVINNKLINYKGKQTLYRQYPQLKGWLTDFIRAGKLNLRAKNSENHARLVDYCNTLLTPSE